MSGATVGLQWVYNERKTKERRTMNEQKTKKRRRKDEEKTNNERRNSALKVKVKWS